MSIISQLKTLSGRATPHLQNEVPAGASRHKTTWTVPFDGTVEKVTLWAVPGSEDSLELRPRVLTSGGEVDLLDYSEDGENFVTAEPNGDEYLMSEPVTAGETIAILAKNTDGTHAYRFRAKVTVDFAGGTKRILGVFN